MRNADRIQAINSEQLATATDRLLLRGGVARVRAPRGSQAQLAPAAPARLLTPTTLPPLPIAPLAQGSQPNIVITPIAPLPVAGARGSQPRIVIAPAPVAPGRTARRASPWIDGDPLPYERTVPARRPRSRLSALAIAIPAVAGVALGIAALL